MVLPCPGLQGLCEEVNKTTLHAWYFPRLQGLLEEVNKTTLQGSANCIFATRSKKQPSLLSSHITVEHAIYLLLVTI